MNSPDVLSFVGEWYKEQCNGDWEHQYGIRLETLDNPGWFLKVDLVETPLQGRLESRIVVERSDYDWFQTWSDGLCWHAACGIENLTEVLSLFKTFVLRIDEA